MIKHIKVRGNLKMMRHKIYRMGDTTDHEYISTDGGGAPGEKRKKRERASPEQVMYQNRLNKAREIRRLIKANNLEWLITLTWSNEKKPSGMEEAKKDFREFRDKMREEYRREGLPFKYIYIIEIGSRGGVHVHMVANDVKNIHKLVAKHWERGHPNIKALYEEGDYRDLARYLTGLPKHKKGKRELDEIKPLDKEKYYYNRSRNMEVPKPEVKRYSRWKIRKMIENVQNGKASKGYVIDRESVRIGINPITGREYLYYSEHRIRGGDT